jgi:hypothetical protein
LTFSLPGVVMVSALQSIGGVSEQRPLDVTKLTCEFKNRNPQL